MIYAPRGRPRPVVGPGAFLFAAVHLDHGYIYGQTNGLVEAGGVVKWVYDPDPAKVAAFQERHPGARAARSLDEILDDEEIRLVVAAAAGGDHLLLVNGRGEPRQDVAGKVGYPFFGQLVLECLNRTENAMTQRHAFMAAELCLLAQKQAITLGN